MAYYVSPSPMVGMVGPQLNDKPGLMGAYSPQAAVVPRPLPPMVRPNHLGCVPGGPGMVQSSLAHGAVPNVMIMGRHQLSGNSPVAGSTPGASPMQPSGHSSQPGTGPAPIANNNLPGPQGDASPGRVTSVIGPQMPATAIAGYSSVGCTTPTNNFMTASPSLFVNTVTPPGQYPANIAYYQYPTVPVNAQVQQAVPTPGFTPHYTVARPLMPGQTGTAPVHSMTSPAYGQTPLPPNCTFVQPAPVYGPGFPQGGAYIPQMRPAGPVMAYAASPQMPHAAVPHMFPTQVGTMPGQQPQFVSAQAMASPPSTCYIRPPHA